MSKQVLLWMGHNEFNGLPNWRLDMPKCSCRSSELRTPTRVIKAIGIDLAKSVFSFYGIVYKAKCVLRKVMFLRIGEL